MMKNDMMTPEMAEMPASNKVEVQLDAAPELIYVSILAKKPLIKKGTVINNSNEKLENLVLKISLEPAVASTVTRNFTLGPKQKLTVSDLQPIPNLNALHAVNNKCAGCIQVKVFQGEEEVYANSQPLDILPLDTCPYHALGPQAYASFVCPTSKLVKMLNKKVPGILTKDPNHHNDPSQPSYFWKDPKYVDNVARANYIAFQSEEFTYNKSLPDQEYGSQRVRMSATILESRNANCVECSTTYCAQLVASGLNVILIGVKGHMLMGYWRYADKRHTSAVCRDLNVLLQHLAAGNLYVVDPTLATAGKNISFESAMAKAVEEIKEPGNFEYFVDVYYAHHHGFPPIPDSLDEQDTQPVTADPTDCGDDEDDISSEPLVVLPLDPGIDLSDLSPEDAKLKRWEYELMNLGLNNQLLNLKPKGALPLYVSTLEKLVGTLNKPCTLLPRPQEWDKEPWEYGKLNLSGENRKALDKDLGTHRLRSPLESAALTKAVTDLSRAAEKAGQATGIHTLYLAAGILRWEDTDRKGTERICHAPVLLYPVEFGRKNNQTTVTITGPGELNETLIEKLRTGMKLDLRGLTAADGPKTPSQILDVLKKAIVGYKSALVLECACLGHFTFRTDAQYTELRDNRETILKHCVCRSLVKGQLQWDARRLEVGGPVSWDAEEPILTRDLDDYQMHVVKYSQENQAFLVFGPPGCGKSTTLGAAIKNAMAQGKRILFVAYQAEAQDAVYKELQKDGLESYALVLRMGAAGKQFALRQLNKAAQREDSHSQITDYQAQRDRTVRAKAAVSGYYEDLYREGVSGKSLYQLIDSFESVRTARGLRKETLADAEELTAERLEQQEHLLDRILYAASQLKPHTHPLKGLNRSGRTPQEIGAIREELESYAAALTDLSDAAESFALRMNTQPPKTYQGLTRLVTFARDILPWQDLPHNFGDKDPVAYYQELQQLADDHLKAEQLRRKLLRTYSRDFVYTDARDLLSDWEACGHKPGRKLLSRIQKYTSQALTRDAIAAPLDQLCQISRLEDSCREGFARHGSALGLADPADADWNQVKARVERCLCQWNAQSAKYPAQMLRSAAENCHLASECVRAFDAADTGCPDYLAISREGGDWIRQGRNRCKELQENLGLMPKWSVWNDLHTQARQLHMDIIPQILEQREIAPEAIRSGYRKAIHRSLMEQAVTESDALSSYQDVLFQPALEDLFTEQEKLMALGRDEIARRIQQRIDLTQESVNGQEAALFQRWLKSAGSLSLRKLFEAAPNIVKKLCPCIIASPEALATYLPYVSGEFDIVVFDEASQLTPAESVAAIARGKEPGEGGSLIICGDPQQMPPSRYFAAAQNGNTEDLRLVELESVLDESIALNMPQARLMHHYRSREDLIAFSNHAFYDGKLITMPEVTADEFHVKLHQVNGQYGRGGSRCNQAEAEAIVAELKERCRDEKRRSQSVGIITMNVQQQALVEKLLAQACAEDAELTGWLQSAEEKLFVQNLESVQGTERDVILLSLNYGPGADGKLSLAMGPLTREGGYRRFNVAISRAREEMHVYASFLAEDIDQHKTTARGMLALRDFLLYARTGILPTSEGSTQLRQPGSISRSICKALTQAGYTVREDLGSSAFRVNLAVKDKDDENRYRLGILLDEPGGPDRDRLARQLEKNGWQIHRIHAMDWYRGPELVIRELLEKLAA